MRRHSYYVRIEQNGNGDFRVRYRPVWWPFWFQMKERHYDEGGGYSIVLRFDSLEQAQDAWNTVLDSERKNYLSTLWRVVWP